jgi:hypothetical protein
MAFKHLSNETNSEVIYLVLKLLRARSLEKLVIMVGVRQWRFYGTRLSGLKPPTLTEAP